MTSANAWLGWPEHPFITDLRNQLAAAEARADAAEQTLRNHLEEEAK